MNLNLTFTASVRLSLTEIKRFEQPSAHQDYPSTQHLAKCFRKVNLH